jgi:hypothetical protein
MRVTLHERRFTRKRSGSAIAAEAFMNNAGWGFFFDAPASTYVR